MTQTLLDLPTNTIPAGSTDFVSATVTDRNGANLTMDVELSVSRADETPTVHSWRPAEWLGDPAAVRVAQTVSVVDTSALDADQAGTRYGVYVRLNNGEAHPIIQVGWIVLTA